MYHLAGMEDKACSICMSDFEAGESAKRMVRTIALPSPDSLLTLTNSPALISSTKTASRHGWARMGPVQSVATPSSRTRQQHRPLPLLQLLLQPFSLLSPSLYRHHLPLGLSPRRPLRSSARFSVPAKLPPRRLDRLPLQLRTLLLRHSGRPPGLAPSARYLHPPPESLCRRLGRPLPSGGAEPPRGLAFRLMGGGA